MLGTCAQTGVASAILDVSYIPYKFTTSPKTTVLTTTNSKLRHCAELDHKLWRHVFASSQECGTGYRAL